MSLIWIRSEDGVWENHQLDHDCIDLASGAPATLDSPGAYSRDVEPGTRSANPVIVRTGDAHGLEQRVLLCSCNSRIRINGIRVDCGIQVLIDRDAIATGDGHTVFFSSERLAKVEAFPGTGNRTSCIRCKLPLEPGTPAVRCPAPECGFWHHHANDQSCWTYATTCASCGHPTDFESGYQWSPASL